MMRATVPISATHKIINKNTIKRNAGAKTLKEILKNYPCQVLCGGGKATGKHFGAYTCEGCKAFFIRSENDSHLYKCTCNGDALISKCSHCRYVRMLRIGMSRELVKSGRTSKVNLAIATAMVQEYEHLLQKNNIFSVPPPPLQFIDKTTTTTTTSTNNFAALQIPQRFPPPQSALYTPAGSIFGENGFQQQQQRQPTYASYPRTSAPAPPTSRWLYVPFYNNYNNNNYYASVHTDNTWRWTPEALQQHQRRQRQVDSTANCIYW